MSYYDLAKDLYDMSLQGQMMEAFEKYYAEDCVIVEKANGDVRNGKAAQRKALEQWMAMVKEFHANGYSAVGSDEANRITFVESWVDVTFHEGGRMKMEEVAVQKWNEDGQIVHEAFYYNMPGQ